MIMQWVIAAPLDDGLDLGECEVFIEFSAVIVLAEELQISVNILQVSLNSPVASLFVPPTSPTSDCSSTWESDAFRLCGDAFRVIEGISQSGSVVE